MRDQLAVRTERLLKAVNGLRCNPDDLDLAVELFSRQAARHDRVLHEFVDALDEAVDAVPAPAQRDVVILDRDQPGGAS